MTDARPADHQRHYPLLRRIVICAGFSLATLLLAIGLIDFEFQAGRADNMGAAWHLDSSKTGPLRLEFWLRDMVPAQMQPACFSTDEQVCKVADWSNKHVDFYGHPSEGVDLSAGLIFCVCGLALLPALLVLGLTIWLTGSRARRKLTSTG